MENNFQAIIQTTLDTSRVKTDLQKYQQKINKEYIRLNVDVAGFNRDITNIQKQVEKFVRTQNALLSNNKSTYADWWGKNAGNSSYYKAAESQAKILQAQKDQFNKKNLSAIDMEIKAQKENAAIYRNQIKAQMQERIAAENKIQAELKQTAKEQQSAMTLKSDKVVLNNQIATYLKDNTKLTEELKSKLLGLKVSLGNLDAGGLKNAKRDFVELKSEATALGITGSTIFQKFKGDIGNFLTFLSAGTAVMGIISSLRYVVGAVTDVNSAMVSLKKVTSETDATYDSFLVNTAQKAKELGATMSDLIESTADFARLGYTLADASDLAEVATLYKNVGDGIDMTESTQSLISTMKAFNIEAEKSVSIVDKFNEVGNNFSISSAGVGTALQKSASAMASANNTLDESIALIVAGNNVVQDPDSVGTALKTVSLRLRSTSTELEALGEESDDACTTVSNLRDLLLGLTDQKVDIQIDEDTYASTYDIMLQMSKVWKDMTDMEQASALEAMFGKRQANIGASIISNMADAEDALTASLNSSGSAMREQEKYQEGIQYSSDRLKASLQELATVSLNSSTVKGFFDLANGLVEATTAAGGLTPVIMTLGTILMAWKTGILPSIIAEIGNLMIAQTGWTASTYAQAVAQVGLTGAIKATVTAMKAFLTTTPVGIILGLVAAVAAAITVYNHFNVTLEEQHEITTQLQSDYDELTGKITAANSELETTKSRIDELNAKDSLTLIEQSELETLHEANRELRNQIDLLKTQEELKGSKVAESTKKEFDKEYGSKSNVQETISEAGTAWYDKSQYTGTGEGYVDYEIDRIKELNALKADGSELTKAQQKEYKKLKEDLVAAGLDYQEYADSYAIDDETKQSWLDMVDVINSVVNPGEYKANLFSEMYDSKDFADAKKELEEMATAGTLSPEVFATNEEYNSILKETGLTVSEVIEHINALVGSTSAGTSETTANIEEVKSAFGDLSASLVTASESATGFYDSAGDNADISKLQSGLSSATSAVKDYKDMLDSLDENGITTDIIDNIVSKYPQLLQYIGNEAQLREQLKAGMEDQNATAQDLYTDMMNYDQQFYQTAVLNNSDLVNSFKTNYGIDLKNYNSLAQAKAATDTKLLSALKTAWASFYSAQATASAGLKLNTSNVLTGKTTASSKALAQMNGEAATIQAINNKIVNAANTQAQAAQTAYALAAAKLKNATTGVNFSSATAALTGAKSGGSGSGSKGASGGGSGSDSASAAEDTTDYWKQAFDEESAYLKHELEMNYITEENYYSRLQALNIKYFANKAEYIDEYRQYEEEVYKGLRALEEERLSKMQKAYENQQSMFENANSNLEAQISLLEESGNRVGSSLYNSLISNTTSQISSLTEEKNALQGLLNDKLSRGIIAVGDDSWYEIINSIQDVNTQIIDATKSVEEFTNSLKEASEQRLDDIVDNLEVVNNELGTYIDLLSNDDLTDEKGFTNEGIATIGLLGQQMETAMFSVAQYSEAIAKLKADYSAGIYSQSEFEEKLEDLNASQLEAITSVQDYKNSIVELNSAMVESVKDGLEKEYDAYEKIIQAKKDALSAEQDLHDYKNSIADKEKDISAIQSQIASLSADDSIEAKARVAILNEDLLDAQSALEEEKYDHSVEVQQDALDTELESYRTAIDDKISILEEYLKNENQVIADSLELAKVNSLTIAETLQEMAEEHGISISESIVSPWQEGSDAIAGYGESLSSFSSDYYTELQGLVSEIDAVIAKSEEMAKSIASSSQASSITNVAPSVPAVSVPTSQAPSSPAPSSTATASSGGLPISKVPYTGKKSSLNINTSVVDRLKYNDYDSSMGARSTLYSHFGGSGSYSGSASQNTWLINKLKENGFSQGGDIGSLISATGEDGFVLARQGEGILTKSANDLIKTQIPIMGELLKKISKVVLDTTGLSSGGKVISVTNHYDNFINVEGNIDKDFTQQFRKLANDTYDRVTKDLYESAQATF